MQSRLDMRLVAIMTIGLFGNLISGLADAQIRNLMPLMDTSETSSLRTISFTCDELQDRSLDCTFVLSQVTQKISTSEIEMRKTLERQDGEPNMDWPSIFQMCDEFDDLDLREAQRRMNEAAEGQFNTGYAIEAAPLIFDLCFGPRTPEALIKFAAGMDELNSRICELRTQTQKIRLEPKGNNAWARLRGPFPKSCGRLEITTLERRVEGSSTKWKLTEQLLYTNDDQDCSNTEEEIQVYDEHEYDKVITLPCDFIKVDWMATQFRQYQFPWQP